MTILFPSAPVKVDSEMPVSKILKELDTIWNKSYLDEPVSSQEIAIALYWSSKLHASFLEWFECASEQEANK